MEALMIALIPAVGVLSAVAAAMYTSAKARKVTMRQIELEFVPHTWDRFDKLEERIEELKKQVTDLTDKLTETERALSAAIRQLAKAGEPIGGDLDVKETES